tara:strand:+ start:3266 stop:3940 length:675 start_codon:yes stop_codon:yes gene_type:complete
MKKLIVFMFSIVLLASCGGGYITRFDENPSNQDSQNNNDIETVENKLFSQATDIVINGPEGWYELSSNYEVYKNIKRIISEESLSDNLIDDMGEKEVIVLKAFSKYNLGTFEGVSPTINVSMVKNIYNFNIKNLKNNTETHIINDFKKIASNVKLNKSNFVEINDINGFYVILSYSLNNYLEELRTQIFFIMLSNKYFLQISLTDLKNDNCQNIFDDFMSNLKL